MNRGASWYDPAPSDRRDAVSLALSSAIAILFAAVAAISFAVDQSVTLSNLP